MNILSCPLTLSVEINFLRPEVKHSLERVFEGIKIIQHYFRRDKTQKRQQSFQVSNPKTSISSYPHFLRGSQDELCQEFRHGQSPDVHLVSHSMQDHQLSGHTTRMNHRQGKRNVQVTMCAHIPLWKAVWPLLSQLQNIHYC